MENIDSLTLKLMSNKSQYNKYLSKTNPEKYKENADYLEKRRFYSDDIMNTIKSILFLNKDITTDVNESFEHFVKECIKYYEMKSLEKKSEESDDSDEDMLFGKMEESTNDPVPKNKNISNYAYWGKKDSTMNPNVNMSNYMYGISP
jgi:hypothetical protein